MTSALDRQEIAAVVAVATEAGARQMAAFAEIGLSPRTLQRWTEAAPVGGIREDRRPIVVRPAPANKLSEEERDRIVAACATPAFASLPPSQIVPRLADQGTYIASESSCYRVLRERGQNHRRGRARPATRRKPPTSFEAKAPCQVWSWDITWLPGPIAGALFYLYLIVDIFSRKIVGWEVHDCETAEFASQVLKRAVWSERCLTSPLVLHADNGSPMKGATMKATMEQLHRPVRSRDAQSPGDRCQNCRASAGCWPGRGCARLHRTRRYQRQLAAPGVA